MSGNKINKPKIVMRRGLILLILFSTAISSRAEVGTLYAPPLGRGNVYDLSSAFSGITRDRSVTGGRRNPALYLSEGNEVLIEANLWNAVPVQSGIESPGLRAGIGAINYLTKLGKGSLTIGYIPRSRLQSSGKYPSGDVNARLAFSELEIAYAKQIKLLDSFGLAARWIRGEFATGVIRPGMNDLETLWRPNMFEFSAGFIKLYDSISVGFVLESPAFGEIVERYPIGNGERREERSISETGNWGTKIGTGIRGKKSAIDLEMSYSFSGMIEAGISYRQTLQERLDILTGLRATFNNQYNFIPNLDQESDQGNEDFGVSSVIAGLGLEYSVNDDLKVVSGVGILFPGNYYIVTPLEDLRPFVLRIGILYSGA